MYILLGCAPRPPLPRERTICATDGTERWWFDSRHRVTRHLVARASKPYQDVCYAYTRDGERVTITPDEWKARQGPRRGRTQTIYW